MLGGYGWYLDELQKDINLFNLFKHIEIFQHKDEITLDKKAKQQKVFLRFFYWYAFLCFEP